MSSSVRTSRTTSSSSGSYSTLMSTTNDSTTTSKTNASSLLEDIGQQQQLLEEQSHKLDKLLRKIEKYEIASIELSHENENFKQKLESLEYANKLNTKKLEELERDTNTHLLKKELELAEFLHAQRDYYERKLSDCQAKLAKNKSVLSDLEASLESIKSELCDVNSHTCEKNDALISEYNESLRQAELNKARLDYLNVNLANLDKHLLERLDQIELLEREFSYLKNSEPNPQVISQQEAADEDTFNEEVDVDYDCLTPPNHQKQRAIKATTDNDSCCSTISNSSCSSSSSDFLAPFLLKRASLQLSESELSASREEQCSAKNNELYLNKEQLQYTLSESDCPNVHFNGLDINSSFEFDDIHYF